MVVWHAKIYSYLVTESLFPSLRVGKFAASSIAIVRSFTAWPRHEAHMFDPEDISLRQRSLLPGDVR